MSMNTPLVVAALQDTAAAVKDSSIAQDAAAAAANVVGKGGFSAQATLGQMLEFQLTGLMVVFVVLGGLTIMCYLMGWILRTVAPDQYYGKKKTTPVAPAEAAARPVAAAVPVAPAGIHPGLSDEQLVILLAVAASEQLGQHATVVRFRPMDSMDWSWSLQGRVGLHNSHQLS